MNDKIKRANKILEIAMDLAMKQDKAKNSYEIASRIDEMRVHETWHDRPADGDIGIVTGNWNNVDEYDSARKCRVPISDLPSRLCRIFEKLGFEIEWSDTTTTCDGCGLLIGTNPTHYGWKPDFHLGDDGIMCSTCIMKDPESYLESLEGNHEECVTLEIDPAEHDYVKVNRDSYEHGFHAGQDDSPKKIAGALRKRGIDRFLFKLDENSQFYSTFSVYVFHGEAGLLDGELSDAETYGPSVSGALQSALQGASAQMAAMPAGGGIKVATCHEDGTATVRDVSEQDFIEGKALDK